MSRFLFFLFQFKTGTYADQRCIVSGNDVGIYFEDGELDYIYGHTHGTEAPPSAEDYRILYDINQPKQMVLTPEGELVIRKPKATESGDLVNESGDVVGNVDQKGPLVVKSGPDKTFENFKLKLISKNYNALKNKVNGLGEADRVRFMKNFGDAPDEVLGALNKPNSTLFNDWLAGRVAGAPPGFDRYYYGDNGDLMQHSTIGDFSNPQPGSLLPGRMRGGGHGERNVQYLKALGRDAIIGKTFSNGVRIGDVPTHQNIAKRSGKNGKPCIAGKDTGRLIIDPKRQEGTNHSSPFANILNGENISPVYISRSSNSPTANAVLFRVIVLYFPHSKS